MSVDLECSRADNPSVGSAQPAGAAGPPLWAERCLSVLSPLLLLVVWEILSREGVLDARFFSSPTKILIVFGRLLESGELLYHLRVSLVRIVLGLLLGGIPAIILGLSMGLFPLLRAAVKPLVAVIYPIPKLALLPLVLLVFGLGEMSKIVVIATGVFFMVLLNTVAGVMNIERIYLDVARNFGASRLAFYWTVALPGALPMILTGIELAIGVAFLLIVAAEFVGANSGIGYLIWNAWQVFSVEVMFAGLIAISLMGYATSLLLEFLHGKLIPWKQ